MCFVQDIVEYDKDSEVVYDLKGKDRIFSQKDHNRDNSSDILLNNQSTVYTIVNEQFFTNIRKSKQVFCLYTNTRCAI